VYYTYYVSIVGHNKCLNVLKHAYAVIDDVFCLRSASDILIRDLFHSSRLAGVRSWSV